MVQADYKVGYSAIDEIEVKEEEVCKVYANGQLIGTFYYDGDRWGNQWVADIDGETAFSTRAKAESAIVRRYRTTGFVIKEEEVAPAGCPAPGLCAATGVCQFGCDSSNPWSDRQRGAIASIVNEDYFLAIATGEIDA
jgi:hypothetical protein